MCLPLGSKTISANKKSKANLRNHIRSAHRNSLADFKCKPKDKILSDNIKRNSAAASGALETEPKTATLLQYTLMGRKLTQKDIDDIVVE